MRIKKLPVQKLKTQLIILFVSFTLFMSSIFIALSFAGLKQIEQELQNIDMGLALDRIRQQYLHGEDVGRKNRFFHGLKHQNDFPDWLKSFNSGFHKINQDDVLWHVMIKDYPDQRYILIRDYTLFESNKIYLILIILAIFLTSGVLSLGLVLLTIRFIVHPIEQLERLVRQQYQAENMLQLSQHFPENEIGRVAQAFDDVYQKLFITLQREKLFSADLSHELRSPLMVILSSCELLSQNSMTEKQLNRILKIQKSAENILARVQVYLDLARQNPIDQNIEKMFLFEIAEQAIADCQDLAQNNQIELILRQQQTTNISYPYIFTYTILMNLIKNAVEYGGVHTQVTIVLEDTGFCVFDNGIGIDEAEQSDVFDPFVRYQHASQHNLGLGLSLVQRICQYLDWKITLSSSPNHGSHFQIKSSKSLHDIAPHS